MLWQLEALPRERLCYFERPERPRLGAERTLPPERAAPDDREGADCMRGALLRDGLETRGARLTELLPELRLTDPRLYEPLLRDGREGVDIRELELDLELVGARFTRDEPCDDRWTRLEERCGMVARDAEREFDRLDHDPLEERPVDERFTRLVERCGIALDREEPDRVVAERFTREEDCVVAVDRLDRWVVADRSPSERQPLERALVLAVRLRTDEVATLPDRLTEVVPAAPPRTVVCERESAPLIAAPEFARTEPDFAPTLRERSCWKLRTELTTCCRCWSNEVLSSRAERVPAVPPPRE